MRLLAKVLGACGLLVVLGAIAFTSSTEALVAAAKIGAGFGIVTLVAFLLSAWINR